MKTAIVVDSTGSLSNDLLNEPYIYQVNLNVTFSDGEIYTDSSSETKAKEFFQKLANSKAIPKTSQPEPGQFIEVLEDIKQKGYENVLFIHLSSALSGTLQTAKMLAKEYENDFNSYFVDSTGTSFVIESLVEQALILLERGTAMEEVVEKLEWVAKESDIYLVVEDLSYLVKGGRISKGSSMIGNFLNIKPILLVPEEGNIELFEKVRTTKRALKRMNEVLIEKMEKYDGKAKIAFAHANAEKQVLKQIGKLQTKYPDTMYRSGFLTVIIGAHVGEGAIGCAVIPLVTEMND